MRESAPGLVLEVSAGSLRGRRFEFGPGGPVLVGRAAEARLRFDPELDLDVSGRHAELRPEAGGWVVRDLESTNGTWVNGQRLISPRALSEGDELWFGRSGPRVRVLRALLDVGAGSPGSGDTISSAPGTLVAEGGDGPSPPPGRGLWLIGVLTAAALVVLVGVLAVQRGNRRSWIAERDRLTARVDSLLARESSLSAAVDAVRREAADSVARARAEVQRLRDRLQSVAATPDGGEVEALRRELQDAMVLLERQELSATLDVEGIRRQVEPAVAMVWSEWPDGRVTTGTAVSVGDGTLLTSRHVVAPDGRGEGERLAVQFAGSTQVWRAEVLGAHPTVDLAWIRPEGIVGEIPTLESVNSRVDTLAPGAPLAIVGFSLGGRAQIAADGSRPRAIVSAGVLVASTPEEIRIRGYGAEGASGSPVVDRDGRLVGVVYGGTDEDGRRVLVAVPIRYSLEPGAGPG